MSKKFDTRLFLVLSAGFILFTIVGTLSHEAGHYLIAILLDIPAEIAYNQTYISGPFDNTEAFLVRLGGPLQTLLTGLCGYTILYINQKTYLKKDALSMTQWVVVFLSLFWLRSLFNFVVGLGGYLINGLINQNNDEIVIAMYLHMNTWSISLLFAFLAVFILGDVFYKYIPAQQKITFLLAGLCGGLIGFYVWMGFLGPVVLP